MKNGVPIIKRVERRKKESMNETRLQLTTSIVISVGIWVHVYLTHFAG